MADYVEEEEHVEVVEITDSQIGNWIPKDEDVERFRLERKQLEGKQSKIKDWNEFESIIQHLSDGEDSSIISKTKDLIDFCDFNSTKTSNDPNLSNPSCLDDFSNILITFGQQPQKKRKELLFLMQLLSSLSCSKFIFEICETNGIIQQLKFLIHCRDLELAKSFDNTIDDIQNNIKREQIGYNKSTETYQHTFYVKQGPGRICGVGHKLWSSAFVLSEFIIQHSEQFRGKKILEIGCGVALASMVVSKFATNIYASDYLPYIIETAQKNFELNRISNGSTLLLDWDRISKFEMTTQQQTLDKEIIDYFETLPEFDIIIGSDLVYSKPIALMLAKTLENLMLWKEYNHNKQQNKEKEKEQNGNYTKPRFYGVMQSSRNGLMFLIEALMNSKVLNLKQEILTNEVRPDLSSDHTWTYIECWLK